MYFMEAEALGVMKQKLEGSKEKNEVIQAENIALIKTEMKRLDSSEKTLLLRYFNGEELRDIAHDLNISPAAARKRKQRIVEKLKGFVLKTLSFFIFLIS